MENRNSIISITEASLGVQYSFVWTAKHFSQRLSGSRDPGEVRVKHSESKENVHNVYRYLATPI